MASPSPSPQGRRPVTPESTLRSRFSDTRSAEDFAPGDASPTSTTISNLSRSAFRGSALPLSASFGTPVRKVFIRADPSLLTCFDPSDKELYDLWTPKR